MYVAELGDLGGAIGAALLVAGSPLLSPSPPGTLRPRQRRLQFPILLGQATRASGGDPRPVKEDQANQDQDDSQRVVHEDRQHDSMMISMCDSSMRPRLPRADHAGKAAVHLAASSACRRSGATAGALSRLAPADHLRLDQVGEKRPV